MVSCTWRTKPILNVWRAFGIIRQTLVRWPLFWAQSKHMTVDCLVVGFNPKAFIWAQLWTPWIWLSLVSTDIETVIGWGWAWHRELSQNRRLSYLPKPRGSADNTNKLHKNAFVWFHTYRAPSLSVVNDESFIFSSLPRRKKYSNISKKLRTSHS